MQSRKKELWKSLTSFFLISVLVGAALCVLTSLTLGIKETEPLCGGAFVSGFVLSLFYAKKAECPLRQVVLVTIPGTIIGHFLTSVLLISIF